MNQRIKDAYKNTREFVTFIQEVLPNAKINFGFDELATHDFTPSVFSLIYLLKELLKRKEKPIKEL